MTRFNTYYMDQALFDLPKVIDTAKEQLSGVDFDTLVGTGFSGGVVIPSLALALGKKFVLIRKETDDSHHGKGLLLGDLGQKWIFVDDLVASGRTRERVIRKVNNAVLSEIALGRRIGGAEMVGQYMYVNYSEDGPYFQEFDPDWECDPIW